LVAENTGTRIVPRGQNKLTRLRRGRASPSASPAVPTQRPLLPELSDDENENDLAHMFDDRVGDDQDLDDLDLDEDAGFIDDDDEDEDQEMGEEEREARRRQKIKEVRERRRQQGTRPEFSGMDQTTWDEIYDVFGDGTDYAWALDDEDVVEEDMPAKPEMRYEDVCVHCHSVALVSPTISHRFSSHPRFAHDI
jgi:transcription elongation factor SPT6